MGTISLTLFLPRIKKKGIKNMAISKPTPKDVGSYEAKLLGPFTQRQVVCLSIGAVPAVLIASILGAIGIDGYSIVVVCIMLMIIPGFLAFGSTLCYGMKPEDFVIEYYQYHLKSRKVRLYETVSLDDKIEVVKQNEAQKEAQKLEFNDKKEPKKDSKSKKQNKDTQSTKTKYKDSRFKAHGHKESKQYKSIC